MIKYFRMVVGYIIKNTDYLMLFYVLIFSLDIFNVNRLITSNPSRLFSLMFKPFLYTMLFSFSIFMSIRMFNKSNRSCIQEPVQIIVYYLEIIKLISVIQLLLSIIVFLFYIALYRLVMNNSVFYIYIYMHLLSYSIIIFVLNRNVMNYICASKNNKTGIEETPTPDIIQINDSRKNELKSVSENIIQ